LEQTELAYNLFENLLTWARSQLENMQFRPETLDMQRLIRQNLDLLHANLIQKNIEVAVNPETAFYAYADQDMVNLVLRNLMSNAIKFTFPGGKITVTVQQEKNYLEISVADTGTGMNQEELAGLFHPDKQFVRYGTLEESGTGLGLILVKEFVERNNGELRVASELNRGSTFSFTLPAASQPVSTPVFA
jgi:signal transduction histidine kinase